MVMATATQRAKLKMVIVASAVIIKLLFYEEYSYACRVLSIILVFAT